MNGKRQYISTKRSEAAHATRGRILATARALFTERGIDKITIDEIARSAGVSAQTIYALFKSKDGLLQAIMHAAIFGDRFKSALAVMDGVDDAVELLRLTAKVARAIYDSETEELGLMRGISAFSPTLRRLETNFEIIRYDMQGKRIELLFAQGMNKKSLEIKTARQLMWMYTNREIYRMLVIESGWSGERFESWLADTLVATLCKGA